MIETDETSMKFKLLFCVMDSGKPGKIMHSSVRVLQSGDLLDLWLVSDEHDEPRYASVL